MSSIGELFIQLGVLGNANELKKANQEFQKANALTEKQNKLDKLRAETLERIQKAETKAEKRKIAEQYRAKKLNIEKQSALKMQLLEKKGLQANIAQWATYAHMVSMASNMAVNSIKKINAEFEKMTTSNRQWANITGRTSSSYASLMKYGRIASLANPNLNPEQVASMLAGLNQKFFVGRQTGDYSSFVNSELANIIGSDSSRLFNRVYNGEFKTFESYLEAIRGTIAGKSPEMQSSIAQAFLGGDDSLLPMLQMGGAQFASLLQTATRGQLSESQVQANAKIGQEIEAIKQHIENVKNGLLNDLTPFVKQFWVTLDNFITYIEPHISKTGEFLAKLYEFFEPTITEIKNTWKHFITENQDIAKVLRSIGVALKLMIDVILVPIKGLIQLGISLIGMVFRFFGFILKGFAKMAGVDVDTHLKNMDNAYSTFHDLLNGTAIDKENAFRTASNNLSNVFNQGKNSNVTFTGDINVTTPQTGAQFATEFMCNLDEQRNLSY